MFWIVTLILLAAVLGWAAWYDWRRKGVWKNGYRLESPRDAQGRSDSMGGGGWAPRGGGGP